jgi:hypothetical protein
VTIYLDLTREFNAGGLQRELEGLPLLAAHERLVAGALDVLPCEVAT